MKESYISLHEWSPAATRNLLIGCFMLRGGRITRGTKRNAPQHDLLESSGGTKRCKLRRRWGVVRIFLQSVLLNLFGLHNFIHVYTIAHKKTIYIYIEHQTMLRLCYAPRFPRPQGRWPSKRPWITRIWAALKNPGPETCLGYGREVLVFLCGESSFGGVLVCWFVVLVESVLFWF